ncbi:UNVERIFIED_CONTAM: hypothetical protein K2H54_038161 [Gekko kuhli]
MNTSRKRLTEDSFWCANTSTGRGFELGGNGCGQHVRHGKAEKRIRAKRAGEKRKPCRERAEDTRKEPSGDRRLSDQRLRPLLNDSSRLKPTTSENRSRRGRVFEPLDGERKDGNTSRKSRCPWQPFPEGRVAITPPRWDASPTVGHGPVKMDGKPDEVVDDEDDEVYVDYDDEDDDDEDDDEVEEEEEGAWVSRRKRPLRRPEAQVELKPDSKASLRTESKGFSEEETEEEFGGEVAFPPTTGPAFLTWTPTEVADWIDSLGFPQYKVKKKKGMRHTIVPRVLWSQNGEGGAIRHEGRQGLTGASKSLLLLGRIGCFTYKERQHAGDLVVVARTKYSQTLVSCARASGATQFRVA